MSIPSSSGPLAAAPIRHPAAPTVHVLSVEECVERLGTASVARVGFVTARGLQIIPLNYRVSGEAILLSTTPNGSLSQLAEMGAALTFEVDEHDSSTGEVWSVLVQGTVAKLPRRGADRPVELVDSWPGAEFAEALRFTPHSYSGRLLEQPPADGTSPVRTTVSAGTTP